VGKPFEAEARVRRFDGEYRWFLTRACPLFDRSGDILRWYGNDIDIHDMKQAEVQVQASLEQKEALLREVHHRVKNNLQLISSLLSLQAARIEDPAVAELFAESRNRVRSMALVHENLSVVSRPAWTTSSANRSGPLNCSRPLSVRCWPTDFLRPVARTPGKIPISSTRVSCSPPATMMRMGCARCASPSGRMCRPEWPR
jgi:hypothetical protein